MSDTHFVFLTEIRSTVVKAFKARYVELQVVEIKKGNLYPFLLEKV